MRAGPCVATAPLHCPVLADVARRLALHNDHEFLTRRDHDRHPAMTIDRLAIDRHFSRSTPDALLVVRFELVASGFDDADGEPGTVLDLKAEALDQTIEVFVNLNHRSSPYAATCGHHNLLQILYIVKLLYVYEIGQ